MDELFANLTLDSTTTIMAYDKEKGDYVELQELLRRQNRFGWTWKTFRCICSRRSSA